MIKTFQELLEKTKTAEKIEPKVVEQEVWSSKEWERIGKTQTEEILRPFLAFQIERAPKNMPEIYGQYASKKISFKDFKDLYTLPALVKDTTNHSIGFRKKVRTTPYVMLPRDVETAVSIYKSGGTRGMPTPTFITEWDRGIETKAVKKVYEYMGMTAKDVLLNTYNPTHKGGLWNSLAGLELGAKVLTRRTTDTAAEIIETIKHYRVTVLATVQGPLNEGDKIKKGGGVDFISLIEAGEDTLEDFVQTLFISGYKLMPEVIAWAETHDKKVANALGSSEAIPQATGTIPGDICKYNNLHLLNGPHYVEIVKQESGQLVPVKRGETGILTYTTIAREGTIYIRYAPGDAAKLLAYSGECDCGIKTPIISDVRRIDIPEDTITAGCCIG